MRLGVDVHCAAPPSSRAENPAHPRIIAASDARRSGHATARPWRAFIAALFLA
jgi:hypothetical protein